MGTGFIPGRCRECGCTAVARCKKHREYSVTMWRDPEQTKCVHCFSEKGPPKRGRRDPVAREDDASIVADDASEAGQ